jgi:aryl-alcohol dehydrogenase-like predicted oxidoreductase
MKTTNLGPLTVSAQGLGCMGMSQSYGVADDAESVATLNHALDIGVTLFDTANVYGDGANERLLSRVVKARREEVTLATKFGITGIERTPQGRTVTSRGDAAYVHQCCDESLDRLGIDVIDLYYMHRSPQNVEIEATVGAMAELVDAGKVRHLGLSEVTADQLRRAYAVHPIAAVQSEYSLWTRDVEDVTPAMAELGVGLVPFSPLGRGYLTGTFDRNALAENDMRRNLPRFQTDTVEKNSTIVSSIEDIASAHGVTASQVALAWVYAQSDRLGVTIVPIPGTKRRAYLDQNAAAPDLELTAADLAMLDGLADQVSGSRY